MPDLLWVGYFPGLNAVPKLSHLPIQVQANIYFNIKADYFCDNESNHSLDSCIACTFNADIVSNRWKHGWKMGSTMYDEKTKYGSEWSSNGTNPKQAGWKR